MKNTLVGLAFFSILFLCFQYTIIEKTDIDSIYPYKMKLYFSRVDGLREGTEVYVLGNKFGIIREIKQVQSELVPDKKLLDPGKEFAIELIVSVQEPLTLWENYEIKFKSKTAFSGRTLDINPGSEKSEIEGSLQPFRRLESKSFATGKYYDDFFAAANNTIKENDADIRKTFINLREISTKLNGTKGALPAFINSETAYLILDDTTVDASIILKEFRRYQEGIRETDIVFIPFSLVLYRQLVGSIYGNN